MPAWTDPPVRVTTDDFDQPTYQALSDDLWYLRGPTIWTPFAYGTGWGDYGTPCAPGAFKQVGDFIVLSGCAKQLSGATSTVFTLPVGARPAFTQFVSIVIGGGLTYAEINGGSGVVVIGALPGLNAQVFFDGVRFRL